MIRPDANAVRQRTLLRRDGMMLARYPDTESMMAKRMPAKSPWYARVEENGGTYRSPGYLDGIERVVSVHPLREYPLVIDVTISEQAVLASWRRQSEFIGLGAISAIVGFVILIRTLALQFRRLEQSREHLEKQTAGLVQAAADLRSAKDDAEAANYTKSQFLANMSHELRTPLNAVLGFSELIRDAVLEPVGARYREYAGDIHAAGQHLLRLINDVLDLSKIEANRLELHNELLNVTDIINECCRLVVERAREQKVKLETSVPADLPPIMVDRLRFKQIILNLLSNAVKFTPAGGLVHVTASLSTTGGLVLTIADNGIGMAPKDMPVALAPFRQIEANLNRRYEGTGLGLPLARKLTELHGGRLEIESGIGMDTTVRVYLPNQMIFEGISKSLLA